jgi:hypothetical protein
LYIVFAEKMIGMAVLLTALMVGLATIHHGDISLGLLFLLGQIQTLIGHHGHSATHEATHMAVHRH